jgi:hypothetical protein
MYTYFIRDNKIYKGKIIKTNRRDTAAIIDSNILNKNILVSLSNCFKEESKAIEELNRQKQIAENKEIKFQLKQKEIDNILEKIYREFGVEIRILDRPVLLEDAEKLYNKIKKQKIGVNMNKDLDYTKIKTGTKVLGKYNDSDEWEETEFLKYDKDMEYGKFICLTWTHDGKVVDVFDEIKLI